ncbi:Fe2OG dioxygenase domain-containing protein [Favolaschia claudopus]|uniref:Fe2OG dioxygenase domain-containing protein n=1 Tax=Favolaschia claudopus TaxID=2862362 RepID=A0AAW0E5L8_9AGAR
MYNSIDVIAPTFPERIELLRRSAHVAVPYTAGVLPVKAEDLFLYYDIEGQQYPRCTQTTEFDELCSACQKETSSSTRDFHNVGKMDSNMFATRLDVSNSGLLTSIKPDIIPEIDMNRNTTLTAELTKLNIYGSGSHSKAQNAIPTKNLPHNRTTVIGSLMVIFPTPQVGGALILEHRGSILTFDCAAELATAKSSVAYVAFYGDVKYAFEPLRFGHRVILTYDLILRDTNSVPGVRFIPNAERMFEEVLRIFLADSSFLPTGGFLAFGLAHEYPMPSEPELDYYDGRPPPSRLEPLTRLLLGSDARVHTIATRVGLESGIKILYQNEASVRDAYDVMTDDVLNTDDVNTRWVSIRSVVARSGTILKHDSLRSDNSLRMNARRRLGMNTGKAHYEWKGGPIREENPDIFPRASVHWVTELKDVNRVASHYMRFSGERGEASVDHVYGHAALLIRVPAFNVGVRASNYSM